VKLPAEWITRPVTGQRTSAVSYVLHDLREAITSETLKVGERLPSESALAVRYSVSRAVVREVLRSLESTGMTMTRTGRGTFVVSSHPAELIFEGYSAMHLMEARPGIEVPAAGLAALRRSETQLQQLRHLSELMEAEHDNAVWTPLDASFHLAIAQASGNPVFADVLSSIAAALRGQSEMLNVKFDRRAASLAEHRAIVEGITRGLSVEAEDAMRFHLNEVHDALATSMTAPRQGQPG
jgi:GntR family transcriptional repressor for pyruvate dehydrogenase complex